MPKAAKITDTGLKSVAVGCPNLATLDVAVCYKITDTGLKSVANGCLNLATLDAEGCYKITDTADWVLPHSDTIDGKGTTFSDGHSQLRSLLVHCSTILAERGSLVRPL